MSGNFLYVTVAGIYALRRLQIKRCGRLGLKAVLALACCLVLAWMSKLGWCWWYLYFKVSREKTYRRFVWQSDFRHGWEWCRELSVDGLCRRLAFGYQMVAVRGCCCRNLRTQAWTICFVDWTLACSKVFCWWPWSIWILDRTSVSWFVVFQGFEAVQIFNVPRGLGCKSSVDGCLWCSGFKAFQGRAHPHFVDGIVLRFDGDVEGEPDKFLSETVIGNT